MNRPGKRETVIARLSITQVKLLSPFYPMSADRRARFSVDWCWEPSPEGSGIIFIFATMDMNIEGAFQFVARTQHFDRDRHEKSNTAFAW